VIDATNGKEVEVSYCLSNRTVLADAIKDLQDREESHRIGFICTKSGLRCTRYKFVGNTIEKWARSKSIEQVIWTDLESNFCERKKTEFTVDGAFDHIKGLPKAGQEKAAMYVFCAPAYVKTPLRDRLMKEQWFLNLKPAQIMNSPC
jgi:hypothetical protein